MKKFFALLLLMALSTSVSVLAAEVNNGMSIEGYIEYETANTVTVVSSDGERRVILNITPDTRIEDMLTGLPLSLAERSHDRVIAYYGPITTHSEPPQSNAVLILGNVPDSAYNGNDYAVQNDYNGYERYNGYNFYENGYNGYNDYNGQAIVPAPVYIPPVMSLVDALAHVYADFYTIDNVTMAPLRQVAESMGFTVIWNDAARSVTLQHSDGQVFGTVTLGQGSFEGRYLEAAPTIHNERTFVPVSFFEILLGM